MPKKSTKKKATRKKTTLPVSRELRVEKALVENFIALQKVLTNLSGKFEQLSDRIDKLLDVFEISAKALAEKDFDFENNNKDVLDKLDELFDQNKTIARGLTMLHEGPEMEMPERQRQMAPPPRPIKPLPRQNLGQKIKKLFPGNDKPTRPMPPQRQQFPSPQPQEEYQDSILTQEISDEELTRDF